MKTKVAYITSTLTLSGPVNQLFNIVNNLDKNVFEPLVITLSPETNDSLISRFKEYNINVVSLNLSRLEGMFRAKKKLEALLLDFSPSIIHTQGLRADVLSSKICINAKRVATIRNYPQTDFSITYGKLKGKVFTHLQVKALRKINVCVGVSESVRKNLEDSFKLSNVTHVLNGVRDDVFTPADIELKNKCRKEIGFGERDDLIILSSLGKDARKNGALIAKATTLVEDKSIKFIFIERGDQYDICKEITSGSNNVFYAGRVQDVKKYINASDAYISASHAEGMPNAVLESLSAGLPTLLSDIGPHVEIKDIAPDVVYIFNRNSVKDVVDKIGILSNKYKIYDFKNKCRSYAISEFSASKMSNEYQAIYKRLLS